METTDENCTGKSKLTSEVRLSREKNSKKPYLEQVELINNFNRSSKAKFQNGVKYFDAYWTLYCFCQSDNFSFADQPLN